MQIATFVVQLVLLVAYGIGVCVVIKTLKTQNKSQSELMANMKQYADLFRVEEFKKYAEMTGENIRMELEKKREKDLEEQKKILEKEMGKAKEGLNLIFKEMKALFFLSSRLVSEVPENKNVDSILDRMSDESKLKPLLLEARKDAKESWERLWKEWNKSDPTLSQNMLAAVLLGMDTNKKP